MPVGEFDTFDDCVKAQMAKGKSKKSAGAICGKIEKDMKESTSKNQEGEGVKFTLVGARRPNNVNPKFDQNYVYYMPQSIQAKTCQDCAHFIRGNGEEDNACQLVKAMPQRILPEGVCRVWRDVNELEGFIPIDLNEDDSLPQDMIALFGEKDVEEEEIIPEDEL